MTVKVSKPAINVRSELSELRKPSGTAGEAMLRAETPQEQFNLIGAGRRNMIINGAMKVAQRGTSVTGVAASGYRTCDRWFVGISSGTHTVTQDSSGPDGFANSLKLECTATGSDNNINIQQRFEGQDLQRLAYGTSSAKQITLSFWVRSNSVGRYSAELYNNDSLRQISKTYTINTSGTWEYKTLTFPADTSNGFGDDAGLSLYLIMWISTSSAFTYGTQNTDAWASSSDPNRVNSDLPDFLGNTGNYFQITGVQLELGKVATPFEHRSYGEELALCQRYYYKMGQKSGERIQILGGSNASSGYFNWTHPVEMRASPTFSNGGGGTVNNYSVAGVPTSIALSLSSRLMASIVTSGGVTYTFGNSLLFYETTPGSLNLSWDAEL
jgi:hypothetical protein